MLLQINGISPVLTAATWIGLNYKSYSKGKTCIAVLLCPCLSTGIRTMRHPGLPIAAGMPWDPLPGIHADKTHHPAVSGPTETTFPLLYRCGEWERCKTY